MNADATLVVSRIVELDATLSDGTKMSLKLTEYDARRIVAALSRALEPS